MFKAALVTESLVEVVEVDLGVESITPHYSPPQTAPFRSTPLSPDKGLVAALQEAALVAAFTIMRRLQR
jgi:hypothetical protein